MKQTEHKSITKKGINNATAGMMGAAVGGIVGAAAGIALSDKQKRQMVLKKMDELKRYVVKALDEISQMSEDVTDGATQPPMSKSTKKAKTKKRTIN